MRAPTLWSNIVQNRIFIRRVLMNDRKRAFAVRANDRLVPGSKRFASTCPPMGGVATTLPALRVHHGNHLVVASYKQARIFASMAIPEGSSPERLANGLRPSKRASRSQRLRSCLQIHEHMSGIPSLAANSGFPPQRNRSGGLPVAATIAVASLLSPSNTKTSRDDGS